MKLIINIPEEIYKPFMDTYYSEWVSDFINSKMYSMIRNGTPIPDNATNGDVIKALFKPKWIRRMDDVVREEYEFDAVWWNALYQKGGKE